MIKLQGKRNTAIIYTDKIDKATKTQIASLLREEAYSDCKIRIMPDVHAGASYTTVRPDDPVARQELCLMLARYANGGTVPSVELDPAKAEGIKGMDQIADWARDGVYWAVNNGVIGGVNNGDGTFSMDPTGTTWRSAAAKMFTVVMRDVL